MINTHITDTAIIQFTPILKSIFPELQFTLQASPSNPGLGLYSPFGYTIEGALGRDEVVLTELVLYVTSETNFGLELAIVPAGDAGQIVRALADENASIQESERKPSMPPWWHGRFGFN